MKNSKIDISDFSIFTTSLNCDSFGIHPEAWQHPVQVLLEASEATKSSFHNPKKKQSLKQKEIPSSNINKVIFKIAKRFSPGSIRPTSFVVLSNEILSGQAIFSNSTS